MNLQDLALPVYAVGTERDHVAPWRSVYKLHHLTGTELTFVLASGGHNAGIVTEPGHPHRHFRSAVRSRGATTPGADEWRASAPVQEGSWWPHWQAWLAANSSTTACAPPPFGTDGVPALDDAPGTYVHQR